MHRLIRVTVAALCAAALAGCVAQPVANEPRPTTVTEAATMPSLVGRQVEIRGAVVPGSWNGRQDPMRFAILDPSMSNNATVAVVYDGPLPPTFGDQRGLTVVGTLAAGHTLHASSLTMDPVSKY